MCERRKGTIDENVREFFFGTYADSIDDFKMLRGERLQILRMGKVLQEILEQKGPNEYAKYFCPPKSFKLDKSEVSVLIVGVFYGKKLREHKKIADCTEDMSSNLFQKLTLFFKTFKLNEIRPLSEECIKIVNYGTGIRADVICIFCSIGDDGDLSVVKRHAILYDKNGNWNMSNLRKHIKNHLKQNASMLNACQDIIEMYTPKQTCIPQSIPDKHEFHLSLPESTTQIDQCNIEESAIMKMPVFVDENETENDDNGFDTSKILFNQFSTQNLRLLEATLNNNEKKNL